MSANLPTLLRLSSSLGTELDQTALERFDRLRSLLLDWNQRTNLTRITDPAEIEVKLFLDAIALWPFMTSDTTTAPRPHPLRVVDIGAGAGFPGLPLKIAHPEIELLAIEATGKKVSFIQAAIAELGLEQTRAIHGRAEELAHDSRFRGRYDVVVARAVARLPTLLEYCMPFCRPGGRGVFPKGKEAEIEAIEAANALKTLKTTLLGVHWPELPELAGTGIVVVQQAAPAPTRYPRQAGLPAKRPL